MAGIYGKVTFQVATTVLQQTAEEVSRLTHALREDFDALYRCTARTGSYWDSRAGEVFRQRFQAQKSETDAILRRFAAYPQDLLQIAGVYRKADRQILETSQALPPAFIT